MSHKQEKKSSSKHNKKDGAFPSKHIKHDPSAESARAVYGLNNKENP